MREFDSLTGSQINSTYGMLANIASSTCLDRGQAGSVSSTKRALVNVILTNGFVARLSREELEDRKDWED